MVNPRMVHSTQPPLSRKSRSNQKASLTTFGSGVQMQGDEPGALLFQYLGQGLAARGQGGMQEQQRNGHYQTLDRGHQGLGNATGHQLRITGTEQGDGLEGDDHAGDGTQQAEQRGNGGEQLDQRVAAIQHRGFPQDGLVQLQLQGLQILQPGLIADHTENAAQRVVVTQVAQVVGLLVDLPGDTEQPSQDR